MGEHDFRVNIDKAQRDEILSWLDREAVAVEKWKGHLNWPDKTLHILKSLKAMVESFDTTGKQVEDSGDVRHKQKTVTRECAETGGISKLLLARAVHDAIRRPYQDFDMLLERICKNLKELGIKVTDKEG